MTNTNKSTKKDLAIGLAAFIFVTFVGVVMFGAITFGVLTAFGVSISFPQACAVAFILGMIFGFMSQT